MDDELKNHLTEYHASGGMIALGGFVGSIGLGFGLSIGSPILPLCANVVGLCVAVASAVLIWSGFKRADATNRRIGRYFERRREEIRERRERLEQRQRRNQT